MPMEVVWDVRNSTLKTEKNLEELTKAEDDGTFKNQKPKTPEI